MRAFFIIISILLLTGCYTKQQAIRKFCVSSSKDTLITIHDSIQVQKSQVDTVFLQQHSDTVILENDSVRLEYIRYRDTIYLRGIAKPRTLYITKKIPVKVSVPCPPQKEPSNWEVFFDALKWLAIGFMFGAILVLLLRR